MAPRIPEGYVFVPRRSGVNVAAQLLDAAEAIGADRFLSVRTTTNGYLVHEDVAEEYRKRHGEIGEAEPEKPVEIPTPSATHPTEQESLIALSDLGDEAAAAAAEGDGSEGDGSEGDESEEEEEEQQESSEPAPLGVTAENTKAEIEKYASELTPAVDVSKAKNKAEMIEILEHARTAPKSDAE
ncbi:hypothetical protein SEA_RUBYRALPH_29 [Microbacterium phage RubyRalph]|nr:hypothetical protein SEA_RUBYRALPH_29 [Microbacterium phage RubyRalph]